MGTVALVAALLAWVVLLVRTAWLCDDAYITLRTVDNLVSGYGPRWNVDERVQAYTHPLWMLLLALPTALTHEAYFTTLGVSILLSTAAVGLLAFWGAPNPTAGLLAILGLGMSRAFVDFSTSGLENPLTNLLLAIFVLALARSDAGPRRRGRLAFWGAMLACNRLDLSLLVMPALGVELLGYRTRRAWGAFALGLSPLIAWEIFSIVYYGFPFPNTAYAKLGTGIPEAALARQGMWYLADVGRHDPLTLPLIGVSLVLASHSRDRKDMALSLGVVLYLAYVVWIGGDFMRGRYVAAPLFLAMLVLVRRLPALPPGWALAAGAAALGLSTAAPGAPPLTDADLATAPVDFSLNHGIVDERAFWYQATGLLPWRPGVARPSHAGVTDGLNLRRGGGHVPSVAYSIGLLGYYAGPGVHILDGYALADPLLARLPVIATLDWRIGHFRRAIPDGYGKAQGGGDDPIADPGIAQLAKAVALVTRGPLWSSARWEAIWRLNTGG